MRPITDNMLSVHKSMSTDSLLLRLVLEIKNSHHYTQSPSSKAYNRCSRNSHEQLVYL